MLGKLLSDLFGRRSQTPAAGGPGEPKSFFTDVYRNNTWGGLESRSGQGSEGELAAQKVALFRQVIADFRITSMLDLGCGDFHWMRDVAPLLSRYHGVDVVADLIEANRNRYANAQGSEHVSFQCLDLSNAADQRQLQLRKVDLVVCLDVIGHMLNREVDALLRFILGKLEARYFLVADRRDERSTEYLVREKSRYEGIDIEFHPVFEQHAPRRVLQQAALLPGDVYDLYELRPGR